MNNANILPAIAKRHRRRYRVTVTANSVTGFGHPNVVRRYSAHDSNAGAFLHLLFRFMVDVRGALSSAPGA